MSLSMAQLEDLQAEALADDLPIEDEMHAWTEAQVRERALALYERELRTRAQRAVGGAGGGGAAAADGADGLRLRLNGVRVGKLSSTAAPAEADEIEFGRVAPHRNVVGARWCGQPFVDVNIREAAPGQHDTPDQPGRHR